MDAYQHYNSAEQFAEKANSAYLTGNTDAFDMLHGLTELHTQLGHLSLALTRRQEYNRRGHNHHSRRPTVANETVGPNTLPD